MLSLSDGDRAVCLRRARWFEFIAEYQRGEN